MTKKNNLQNLMTSYFQNDIVKRKIENFFDDFDDKIIEKFTFMLKNEIGKGDLIILNNALDNAKFAIEFDNTCNNLTLRKKIVSYDKISFETTELNFSLPSIDKPALHIKLNNPTIPTLMISKKNNDFMNFDLLNQSKTCPIAELEAHKNERYEVFTNDLDGNFTILQKTIQSGKVESFNVKRLNNKDFYFVTERTYNFSPQNYNSPINKQFRKRFVIRHKNNNFARLAEDILISSLENSKTEIFDYSINASPYLQKIYCDQLNNANHLYYLKRSSANPYEINQNIGSERMFEISKQQLVNIINEPLVGDKIFDRKLKKEQQSKANLEVPR